MSDKVTIIAELGLNHDGSYSKALNMISAVRDTGVKIVKFQHYNALQLLGPTSPYLEYASRCQFTKGELEDLKYYSKSVGLEFLVSVFDINDVPWADSLCMRHKVASRMNQNSQFIDALIQTDKQVIVSTTGHVKGNSRMGLYEYMFCIPEYPTAISRMEDLPCNEFLGLSSHCPDIKPTLKAIAQGARFVEHHICIDRSEQGCDKSSSITFAELKELNRFANDLSII